MKKVLLTGASGFIGRHTIPFLIKSGYEVHAITHRVKPNNLNIDKNDHIIWHKFNLLNINEQEKLIRKIRPSHLLHFAWYAKPNDYLTSLENVEWFNASLSLLYNFKLYGGDRVVYAGTCIENTESPYAICKTNLRDSMIIMRDRLYKQLDNLSDLNFAWGRIFYPYGTYDKEERLIPSIINSLLQDRIAYCSYGEQVRDFIYVKDVASAFVTLLNNDINGDFNISSGIPVKLKDVIEFIGKKLDKEDLIHLGSLNYRENEIMEITGYPCDLKSKLKWSPKYSLDEGLNETIEWCKNQLNE